MQTKKTPQADLESKRGIMFLIGLILSLVLIYIVINYENPKPTYEQITITLPANNLEIQKLNNSAKVK